MANYDPNDDPEFIAYQAELERQCGASFTTGGHDPYGTNCDLLRGHEGPHRGGDPMGSDDRIEWRGGGTIAGDAVPNRDVRRIRTPGKTLRTCGHPGFVEDGRCGMGHGWHG